VPDDDNHLCDPASLCSFESFLKRVGNILSTDD
jgi:hypothetical protein